MTNSMKTLFVNNPELDGQIAMFCAKNQGYLAAKQKFYDVGDEIGKIVGYDLYDRFEKQLIRYLGCSNDIYYLFGLGLRQDILSALQSEMT